MPKRSRLVVPGLVIAALACCGGALAQDSPRTVLLHAFGQNVDTATPAGALIADAQGNLYGISLSGGANGYGTVFELSPPNVPGRGRWIETVLYSFPGGSSGAYPQAPLHIDAQGNLYGVTEQGGGNLGTVFQLRPPTASDPTGSFAVLYAFHDIEDGAHPAAGLAEAPNQRLYGTTFEGGTYNQGSVYELTPPAVPGNAWTETVIHSFSQSVDGVGPMAPLLVDTQGRLYGTTATGPGTAVGSVFVLSPPTVVGGAWTQSVLHVFTADSDGSQPVGGLIADAKGNLYGATFGGGSSGFGTVFELSPPAIPDAAWIKTTIHSFTVAYMPGPDGGQPLDGLIMDQQGNLYGTTSQGGPAGHGTVFQLTPPASAGGLWTQTILSALADWPYGRTPLGGLVMDANGNLFGTAGYYGAFNHGTAFEVIPVGIGRST